MDGLIWFCKAEAGKGITTHTTLSANFVLNTNVYAAPVTYVYLLFSVHIRANGIGLLVMYCVREKAGQGFAVYVQENR